MKSRNSIVSTLAVCAALSLPTTPAIGQKIELGIVAEEKCGKTYVTFSLKSGQHSSEFWTVRKADILRITRTADLTSASEKVFVRSLDDLDKVQSVPISTITKMRLIDCLD